MPTVARRFCLTPRCKHRSGEGSAYCDHCKSKRDADHERFRGSRHKRGYGTAWERLRKQILRRDNYACQICKRAGIVTPATEVDHKIPKHRGGGDDPINLQSLCQQCHAAKTAKER